MTTLEETIKQEGNHVEFEYRGYPCILWRSIHYKPWCGYIGLQPGHPWYRKQYKDIPIEGLSYSRECGGPVCHKAKEGEQDMWWIGFQSTYKDSYDVCLELGVLIDRVNNKGN